MKLDEMILCTLSIPLWGFIDFAFTWGVFEYFVTWRENKSSEEGEGHILLVEAAYIGL